MFWFVAESIQFFRNINILPIEWFDHSDKMQKSEVPTYGTFYKELRNCNSLGAKNTDYVKLFLSGLYTEPGLIK